MRQHLHLYTCFLFQMHFVSRIYKHDCIKYNMHIISNFNPTFPPFQLLNILILILHQLMLVNVSFLSIVLSNSSNDIRQLDFLRCISCIRPHNTKQGFHFFFYFDMAPLYRCLNGNVFRIETPWRIVNGWNSTEEKTTICSGNCSVWHISVPWFKRLHTTFFEEMHKIFLYGSINGSRQQVSHSNHEPIVIKNNSLKQYARLSAWM